MGPGVTSAGRMVSETGVLGTITLGTSGFSFDDWVGTFYPERTRKADMLGFYATHFSAVASGTRAAPCSAVWSAAVRALFSASVSLGIA